MTKQEIIHWMGIYDAEMSAFDKDLEKELGEKLRQSGTLNKEDFLRIFDWKFQGSLKGRGKHFKKMVGKYSNEYIQSVISTSLVFEKDFEKINSLAKPIDGAGPAIASVVLSFHNPHDYCVFDFHVWDELFGERLEDYSSKNYVILLNVIRSLGKQHGFNARDIERAYFMKNLKESQK